MLPTIQTTFRIRCLKAIASAGIVLTWLGVAQAFSLLGPLASWMTPRLGYDTTLTGYGMPSYGGPMNLGEEYRWNVPVVYYSFTPAFLNFFGQRGVEAVDKAAAVLNDLPPASQLKLQDYPLTSQRINYQAQALQLLDLKSVVLSLMLEQLGLCSPNRFVYTLRNRWIGPGPSPTNYLVIRRNFDPQTWNPTPFINGELWTYATILEPDGSHSLLVTTPVDPTDFAGGRHSPVAGDPITGPIGGGFGSGLVAGGFWTGLTRDDVGGLKYIYRQDNYNIEGAPPTAFGSGSSGGSYGFPLTTLTNLSGTTSPYDFPSQLLQTNATGGTGGGTNAVFAGATNFVNIALRGGVDKVRFQKVGFDSVLGLFVATNVSWTDSVIQNGTISKQTLQRSMVIPDILYNSADMQGGVANNLIVFGSFDMQTWSNNAAINLGGVAPIDGGNLGPGVINPSTTIPAFVVTLTSDSIVFQNTWPFSLSQADSFEEYFWASFDGSTNEPVIYPQGTSIRDVERRVLGGGGP